MNRQRNFEAFSFNLVMTLLAFVALILIIAPSLVVVIVRRLLCRRPRRPSVNCSRMPVLHGEEQLDHHR